VVGIVYLGLSEQRLMPILQEEGPNNVLFEQALASLHFHHKVRGIINCQFLGKWIGTWSSYSPGLTAVDSLFPF
jgi:hypothetical protein